MTVIRGLTVWQRLANVLSNTRLIALSVTDNISCIVTTLDEELIYFL